MTFFRLERISIFPASKSLKTSTRSCSKRTRSYWKNWKMRTAPSTTSICTLAACWSRKTVPGNCSPLSYWTSSSESEKPIGSGLKTIKTSECVPIYIYTVRLCLTLTRPITFIVAIVINVFSMFTNEDLKWIKRVTLWDVIVNCTHVKPDSIQRNVFFFNGTDPCPQPQQIKPEMLEPCSYLKGFDYFEVTFIVLLKS